MPINYNLDLEPTEYAEKVDNSTISSRHHMSTNSMLYKYASSGKMPLFLKNFIDLPEYIEGETSHLVRENEVNRLDWLSWQYYNTPELWWVIMAVNNIINPFDIQPDTVLRIIPISYVEYNLLRYNI